MNSVNIIFLILIFLAFRVFEFVLDHLNLKYVEKFGDTIPEGFESIIEGEKLFKIKLYTIEKIRFGFLQNSYTTLITFVFFFSGIINIYNDIILSFTSNYYINGILYFWFLTLLAGIFGIPFDLYSTFKIEKKYGFNTMTFKLWLIDFFKSVLISFVILAILVSLAFVVIKHIQHWWFFVWGAFFIFSIFMLYVSPYVIEPLFNKFEQLKEEELKNKLVAVMAKIGIKVSKVLKMDASKRTKHTNAYFSGIGKVKRIVLFDTLLEKISHDEILSIVAHEAGHWKRKHILKRILVFELISLVGIYLAYLFSKSTFLFSTFGIIKRVGISPELYIPCLLLLVYFIFSLAMFLLMPLLNYWSRLHEKEADFFAVNLAETSEHLVNGLKKLSVDNLSNLHPYPLYSLFHYSHPPILERIRYLKLSSN